jgi:hypothetical protein
MELRGWMLWLYRIPQISWSLVVTRQMYAEKRQVGHHWSVLPQDLGPSLPGEGTQVALYEIVHILKCCPRLRNQDTLTSKRYESISQSRLNKGLPRVGPWGGPLNPLETSFWLKEWSIFVQMCRSNWCKLEFPGHWDLERGPQIGVHPSIKSISMPLSSSTD